MTQPETIPPIIASDPEAGPAVAAKSWHADSKVIEPAKRWRPIDFRELWRYRELFYFFIWRDIRVRYKQTVLGAAWAIIQPVMTMIVFSVFFGRLGGMAKNVEIPYPVFVYAALVPWTFFAGAVTQSGQSIVNSGHLIGKVYFPRLLIPAAAVGGLLLDFVISLGVLFLLQIYYGMNLQIQALTVPLFMFGTTIAAVAVGTLLSSLMVAYRDFRHLVPFLVQLWMFASPVAYPLEVVPKRYLYAYALNPMVGMISGFRSAVLGQPWNWTVIGISFLSALATLVVAVVYFRSAERRFVDII